MRKLWIWIGLVLLFSGIAQAQYVKRAEAIQNGAIAFTGNSLGLLKASSANAQGTGSGISAIGAFMTTNTSLLELFLLVEQVQFLQSSYFIARILS